MFTMAGDVWRLLAMCMMKNQSAAGVQKTDDKFLDDPSRMAKNTFSSGLGEGRRTPPASSRPLDNEST